MNKIVLSILFILMGIFAIVTGVFISKSIEQKIFLVIIGLFFVVTAVSIFLNRKKEIDN